MTLATSEDMMGMDELNSILNLQRQEAFDDTTEALHKTLSKRGSLLVPSKYSTQGGPASPEPQEENAEEKLLKIIASQASSLKGGKTNGETSRRSSSRRRSSAHSGRERSKSRVRERSKSRARERSSSRVRRNSDNTPLRQRRSSSRPRPDSDKKRTKSESQVSSLHNSTGALAIDMSGETKRSTATKRNSSVVHRAPEASSRRDAMRKTQSTRSFANRNDIGNMLNNHKKSSEHGRRRSKSPGSLASIGSSESNNNSTRRQSSRRSSNRNANRPSSRQGSIASRGGDSVGESSIQENTHEAPLRSKREQLRDSKRRGSSRRVVSDADKKESGTFDQLWSEGKASPSRNKVSIPKNLSSGTSQLGGFMDRRQSNSNDVDADSRSIMSKETLSTIGGGASDTNRPKKTKLEKIHELQAKCDRYKKEWIETTKGKRRLRAEVQEGKSEILSLSKQIDIHVAETSILQKKLSETLEQLDDVNEEQRKERQEFSTTAKELAESRIEFTKTLNESRELRADMDKLEESLKDRDRTIMDLEDELRETRIKAEDMESDLNFAEEAALKLEDSMKAIEYELAEYRTAAEKNTEGEGSGDNMQQVRNDMERRLFEDRERRLEEKQNKLEEKMKNFEEERRRYLDKEKDREEEISELRKKQDEKSKLREEERHRMDGEISEQLQTLEADNTALQGRLKSEQLETNIKLRQKDERIGSLQKELMQTQKQLSDLNGDPTGTASLQKEVDAATAQAQSIKDELEEALKHNGMLTEEIDELQSGKKDIAQELKALQQRVSELQKDSDLWQRKSGEWEAKSGDWTNKAHEWKEKAEEWEKVAREADPDSEPEAADPQALFLQAALQKKKATEATQVQGSKWNMLGNLLGGGGRVASEDDSETHSRVNDLEAENASQAETIKKLRSEMIKMQTKFKEEAYTAQQKMQEVVREREAVELKNSNLLKELELARKLENFASQDM